MQRMAASIAAYFAAHNLHVWRLPIHLAGQRLADLAACRAFSDNHAKWDFRSEIRRNFQFYNSFERAFAQSTSEN
ncbi:MAG: hypothetical protein WBJ68_00310, partial [Candidatus Dechloromonas phosphoritropha]